MRRHKKTIRHPYTGSKRFTKSCRSHGGCPYCLGNRMYRVSKARIDWLQQMREYGDDRDNKITH